MVKGGDSQSEGCEFESRHRILDGHFSHITCCKNCNNVCLKRPKIHGLAHFENLFCLRAQRYCLFRLSLPYSSISDALVSAEIFHLGRYRLHLFLLPAKLHGYSVSHLLVEGNCLKC